MPTCVEVGQYLFDGMIALQAGGTDVAVARKRDGNGGLDSARQPNTDPVTRLSRFAEIAR